MMVLLSIIGFAILVGTLYDVIIHQKVLENAKSLPVLVGDKELFGDTDRDVDESLGTQHYTPLLKERQEQSQEVSSDDQKSVPLRILLALSIYSNGQNTLSTKRAAGSLDCLHGIRFLSMTWVILGHTASFLLAFCANTLMLEKWFNRWTFQAIGNAALSVDSFFVLSGTLVSYLLLKELHGKIGPRNVNWAMFYFHRIWRLTPAYMLFLGTHVTLIQYLSNGPVWNLAVNLEPDCPKTWWTNLLYINNLVYPKKECMQWGWYLANDMQFFIISPLVIVGFYYKWFVGGAISLGLILVNLISSGIITAEGKATSEYIYVKPWCRIGPYVIGIITGYLLHVTERNRPKLHKGFVFLGWSLAAALNLTVLYGLTKYKGGLVPMPIHLSALYEAFSRTVWGMGLAWVIFACCRGYGGFINTLLSWSAFIPLSRLTYAAYLVHPVIVYCYNLSLNQMIYVDEVVLIWIFLGGLVVSYAFAFVTSLVFEAPMMGLEKVLLRRK